MNPTFEQLNIGWNAEPNAPEPRITSVGNELRLEFVTDLALDPEKDERECVGVLKFFNCSKYRLGSTNDEGWYKGLCRFSKLAPKWGEFYLVKGEPALLNAPRDWVTMGAPSDTAQHFLFYFRDETFECVAEKWTIELPK